MHCIPQMEIILDIYFFRTATEGYDISARVHTKAHGFKKSTTRDQAEIGK